MRHSAHRADTAATGKPAHKSRVSSRRHAATSHRAERVRFAVRGSSHAMVRPKVVSHRATKPSHAAPSAGISALALASVSPKKLIATLGMTAMVGTMGLAAAANGAEGSVGIQHSSAAASTIASAVSFTPVSFSTVSSASASSATSVSGSAVSRSSSRSALESSAESSVNAAGSATSQKTSGEWDLEGSSADSLNAKKVSVAAASNAKVQKKLEIYADEVPSGFDPNHATGDTGNAYPWSQCTWWAYLRRKQLGLPVGSHFGNGAQWAASAKALGYWVDSNPQVGDVMVFARGQEGASSVYGHVAIVEKVENGTVTTSESGASLQGSTMSRTFTNIHDFQYIHF